ncbi:E3 ubiquitin-protein ligase TRIM45-like [Asterias amurensis]|uniref:E3 ubiquitin-protein ligase TRIM45-like n=1 Tax=Asterias amurensis TaxID=7602 RepID=UPI003AB256AB
MENGFMSAAALHSTRQQFQQKYLTCSQCRQVYDDQTRVPKYLPCLHTICIHCLASFVNGKPEFPCPLCKAPTGIPLSGMSAFPTNFNVKKLREFLAIDEIPESRVGSAFICEGCDKHERALVCCANCVRYLCRECVIAHQYANGFQDHHVNVLGDLNDEEEAQLQRRRLFCTIHSRQALTLFCEKCKVAVCQVCSNLAHIDDGHRLVDLGSVIDDQRRELGHLMGKCLMQQKPLEQLLGNIITEQGKLNVNAKTVEEDIHAYFLERHKDLEKREQELIKMARAVHSKMALSIKNQKEAAETTLAAIMATGEFTETAILHRNPVETARAWQKLKPTLSKINDRVFYSKPVANSLIEFRHQHNASQMHFQLSVRDLGKIYTNDIAPFQTDVKVFPAFVDQECKIGLNTINLDGEKSTLGGALVQATLKSPTGDPMTCDLQDNMDGTYHILFSPSIAGDHEMLVCVSKEPVHNEPMKISVLDFHTDIEPGIVGTECLIRLHATDSTGNAQPLPEDMNIDICLKDPMSYETETEETFTSEGSYVIKFLPRMVGDHFLNISFDGTPLRGSSLIVGVHKIIECTSKDEEILLEDVSGIAVCSKGNIFLADTFKNQEVVKLDGDGMFLETFSVSYKNYALLTIDIEDKLTMFFLNRKCVSTYATDGKFIRRFQANDVKNVTSVAVNSRGDTLLLDCLECCVFMYDEKGFFIQRIGNQGCGRGELNFPISMCVDKFSNIYVSDKGNQCVVRVNPDGKYLKQFGDRDSLLHPGSVVITLDGYLLVHDERLAQVVHVFSPRTNEIIRLVEVHGIVGFQEAMAITSDGCFVKVDHKGNCLRKYSYK